MLGQWFEPPIGGSANGVELGGATRDQCRIEPVVFRQLQPEGGERAHLPGLE